MCRRWPSAFCCSLFVRAARIAVTHDRGGRQDRQRLHRASPGAACATVAVDAETGATTQRCPGIAGYSLLVQDDDARMSIVVVAPDGGQHPLEYWQVVTTAFSTLGEKAEWRVKPQKREARSHRAHRARLCRQVQRPQCRHSLPRRRQDHAAASRLRDRQDRARRRHEQSSAGYRRRGSRKALPRADRALTVVAGGSVRRPRLRHVAAVLEAAEHFPH